MITDFELQELEKIKKSLLGTVLPFKPKNPGANGLMVEDLVENLGYALNRGTGIDLPTLGWEIKSKNKYSGSKYKIATENYNSIIHTPYRLSNIFDKFQKHLHMVFDHSNVLCRIELIDFTADEIQKFIELDYTNGQQQLISSGNQLKSTLQSGGYITVFEKTHSDRIDAYDFRVSVKGYKGLINKSRTLSGFSNLFEIS
jgi:hypothetical protein